METNALKAPNVIAEMKKGLIIEMSSTVVLLEMKLALWDSGEVGYVHKEKSFTIQSFAKNKDNVLLVAIVEQQSLAIVAI